MCNGHGLHCPPVSSRMKIRAVEATEPNPTDCARPARLLLLHGLLSSSGVWGPLTDAFDGSVTTIAPDLLGYGSAPRPGGQYTLERIVEHLLPVVEREQPTHIVGHSMGGIIALALASALPNQFERVGIIAMPVFDTRREGLDYLHRRGLFHRAVLHTDYLSHVGCACLQRLRPLWLPIAPLFVPGQPRAVIRGAFDHCHDSHTGSLDNIIFAGHVPRLASEVLPPVAALHGGRDRAAPPERTRALAAASGWNFKLSPTGNHQIIVERPRLVARWIRDSVLTARPDVPCEDVPNGQAQ